MSTDVKFNSIIEIEVLPSITKALHSIFAGGYEHGLSEKGAERCGELDAEFCKMKANELKLTLPKYIDSQVEVIIKTRREKRNDFFEANKNHPYLNGNNNSNTSEILRNKMS